MGTRGVGGGDDARWGASIAGMTHIPRITQGVVGARLGTVFDSGIIPKHVIVAGGVDFHTDERFAVLPSIELGAGSPFSTSWGSPGAYLGGSVASRVRLLGTGEEPAAYNVFAGALDLVVMPRLGAWMPPEGSGGEVAAEWALEMGVRITLGSDLFAPTRGRVRQPSSLEAQ